MAHFARIENGVVSQVIVINNDVMIGEDGLEQESIGAKFCTDLIDGTWVQTSYNANFRGKFAGIGDKYDEETDKFISVAESE